MESFEYFLKKEEDKEKTKCNVRKWWSGYRKGKKIKKEKVFVFLLFVLIFVFFLLISCDFKKEEKEIIHATMPEVEILTETNETQSKTKEEYEWLRNVKITHYCICEKCCGKKETDPAYGITASGRKAEPYLSIAVDPDIIPLGSTVYIDYGDGIEHVYRADDTGSAINGLKIDICVSSHEEALNLGVKTASVRWE